MNNLIEINGKEYKIKYSLRAVFLFEEIAKKSFEVKTTLDNYLFFYCMLLANNEDTLEWNEYIDALDENPSLFIKMNEIIINHNKLEELMNKGELTKDEKKN